MEFRIGVNLGDVMVERDQIYGDGVNVAARLESLAEPGGICISRTVYEQVRNKLSLNVRDLGEQSVKNIAEPVHVWRVLPDASATQQPSHRTVRSYWRGGLFSIAGLAIVAAVVFVVQHVSLKPPHTHASIPSQEKPALPLPDKPSIAVLPFTNMSGDREQEYFSDGITDDLITDLSRLPGLFVIARESTFTYKNKAAKLQDVGRELGVRYVLEGSVRKAAGQVRITVQLADATTGDELWAERYDRPLRDVFALQDEIVRRIVTTLNLQLALSQQGILIPRTTENLEAYDDLLRGTRYFASFTKDGNTKARLLFEKAIERDPKYAAAYALLGSNYYFGWVLALGPDPTGLEHALRMEQKAIALDDSLAGAHSALAEIYGSEGQYDRAVTEARRGITLDPNSASGYLWLADVMDNLERPEEALAAAAKAMRLDPRNIANYLFEEGWAYGELGRWKESIADYTGYLVRYPANLWAHAFLNFDYSALGNDKAAQEELAEVERAVALNPNSPVGYSALALTLNLVGKPKLALLAIEKGMRANPRTPDVFQFERGRTYTLLERWQQAIPPFKAYLARYPDNFWAHSYLAVSYVEVGDDVAAQAEVTEALRLDPQFSAEIIFPTASLEHKALPTEIDRFRADLHSAGLK